MSDQVLLVKREELAEIVGEAVDKALKSLGDLLTNRPQDQPRFVKGNQALADYLNCSVPSVMKWRRLGITPYTKRGRIILYDIEKVRSALESNKLLKRR